MAFKDPEAKRACDRACRAKNRERLLELARAYEPKRPRRAKRLSTEDTRAYHRAYRAKNRDGIRAQQRARYASDPQVRARRRAYRAANAERYRETLRLWHVAHPDVYPHYSALRRARLAGAAGSHTLKQWREKRVLLGNVCIYCGEAKPLTRDHKVPIVRGGTHYIENILPACQGCNSRKYTRTATEFLAMKSAGRVA